MGCHKKREIVYLKRISPEPMSPEEQEAAERILARLVALAYCADHPELFKRAEPIDQQTGTAVRLGDSQADHQDPLTPSPLSFSNEKR
jgi:hypothetical protein